MLTLEHNQDQDGSELYDTRSPFIDHQNQSASWITSLHYAKPQAIADKSLQGRGLLSMVPQVFNELAFVSPFVSIGQRLVREIVRELREWETPLDTSMVER